jgi:hypothetical protein
MFVVVKMNGSVHAIQTICKSSINLHVGRNAFAVVFFFFFFFFHLYEGLYMYLVEKNLR